MRIRFLGTAAAEGAPAIFCTCDHCAYARKVGGREIRTRSGSLIDGVLKLDFGPDSYKHALDNGIDYTYMKSILITHSHSDHCCAEDIGYRRKGFANLKEDVPVLTVYGNGAVGKMMAPYLNDYVNFKQLKVFETVEIEGYQVTPLEAVHCRCNEKLVMYPVTYGDQTVVRSEEAFFYLIEKDGESILYGHDTDEFTPADMEFLKDRHIDLITLDCTNGVLAKRSIGHMGITENLRMREKLLAIGAADEHTRFVANHFSHNGLVSYEEMERRLPGFTVTYDGLELETPTK